MLQTFEQNTYLDFLYSVFRDVYGYATGHSTPALVVYQYHTNGASEIP